MLAGVKFVRFKTVQTIVGLATVLALLGIGAKAQNGTTSLTDGQTPLGLEPGAPAGAYALSGFDNINLFNGNLNFRLPLLQIGGRGGAQMTMTLPIELKWRVLHQFIDIPPNPPSHSYLPLPGSWNPRSVGYGPGVLIGRKAGTEASCDVTLPDRLRYTLTRLTFIGPDGTEYELRDQLNQGKPGDIGSAECYGHGTGIGRGRVFITADGSSMTFISDELISDEVVYWSFYYPTGYLFLRDGTRMRIEGGLIKRITDRNGNWLDFTYDQYNEVTLLKDSLNRTVTIVYDASLDLSGYDEITWRGSQGATRSIKIYRAMLRNRLRTAAAEGSTAYSLRTYHSLFPEIPNLDDDPNNAFDWPVMSAVELPDGRQYRFYYNSYAELARVELPTGGAYEYDHTTSSGVLWVEAIHRRVVERRIYPDGLTLEGKTTYVESTVNNNALVDVNHRDRNGVLLSHEKHYFHSTAMLSMSLDSQTGRPAVESVCYAGYLEGKEYLTEFYDTSGNVLRKVEQSYAQRAAVPWWSTWTGPRGLGVEPSNDTRLTQTVTTLKDVTPNLVTKQEYDYDQFNNRKNTWEWDFAPDVSVTQPIRHTQTNYLVVNDVNNTDYTAVDIDSPTNSIHLRSLPTSQFIFAINPSTGADVQPPAAQTTYEYDKYDTSTNHAPLMNRSGISGHDAGFTTTRQTRGNATAIKRWLDTISSWVTINQQYDIAGNIVKKIDARGKITSIEFADCFGAPNGEARTNTVPTELSEASQTSFAFPTSVSNPLGHTTYTQYDYYIGRAVDGEDERGVIDSGFYNDILDRATQLVEAVNTPDKRQTTYAYNDPARIVTTTTDQDLYNDNKLKAQNLYDALGRLVESRHYETASTYIATQQTYDGMGRVRQVSNPFRPGDTILFTTTDYDALGRKTRVTTPDQAQATTDFASNTSTHTDQAGNKRTTTKDALGRMTSVIEDPGTAPHLNYLTTYTYNLLDRLTHVAQGTSQTRDYSFDTLGRLKQSTIPEQVGSTFYGYDENSNLTNKTDPRGVITTYGYDDINRINSVTYDLTNAPNVVATPNVAYTYDSTSVLYSKGELTGVTVSSANFSSSYTYDEYDSRGRVKQSTQTTDSHAYTMKYGYDLAGHLKTEEYPSHRTITTGYDGAGRVSTVDGTGRATPYAEQFAYAPHGEVKEMKLGNGLWEHTLSNNRLQLTEIGLGTAQGGVDRLKLNYDYGSTTNNGNLLSQTNTVPGSPALSLVQTYGYTDGLNRLTSVQETANQTVRWTQSYVYDRYGNRTSLTNTGSEAALLPTQTTPAVTPATNRLVGFTYDNAGNVRIDGSGNSFEYDAENRQTTAGSSDYRYDGDGLRVRKVVAGITTIFVYDALQRLIAEYTNPDQQPQAGGGTSFLTSDHLGSTRLVTDGSGNVKSRHDYMPFGEELLAGIGSRTSAMKYGAADGLRQKFTGKQRDSENGLDYFGARYYSSPHARFTGADPLMESAHPAMPQTWNRFAYVLDNPLVIIDPNGEGWLQLDGSDTLYWDDRVNSPKDAERLYPGRNARYLPPGTILVVTASSIRGLRGHSILLGDARTFFDLGIKPIPFVELEFYGGNGEKFLKAYFMFVLENAVLGFVGAKAVDAVEALYHIAKARRAGKAMLQMLEAAKKAEGVCFVGSTTVSTSEGDKPIEELKEGDEVLSYDPECGEQALQRVTHVYKRSTIDLLDITVGDVRISCTPEHPFWVDGAGWIRARELKPGTQLLRRGGQTVGVQSIRHREGSFTVYNIEVERLHSYYVSDLAVLVHNQCAAPRRLPFADAGLTARVNQVLDNIAKGVKQFARDGIEFMNKEGRLPAKPSGYYQEYTVPTPGIAARGRQRIVVGRGGEAYYTLDHYTSFVRIR